MRGPGVSTTARSMTFSSSRKLPEPVMLGEQVERVRRELQTGLPVLLAVLLEEVPDQEWNIVLAIAERRQLDRDHVQPVEQILAEPVLLHHLAEIDVGGGDDPRPP